MRWVAESGRTSPDLTRGGRAGRLLRVGTLATLVIVAAALPAGVLTPAARASDDGFAAEMRAAQRHASRQLLATDRTTPAARYPYYTDGYAWRYVRADGWATGYYPGTLWFEYQRTGDTRWRDRALSRQAAIGALEISPTLQPLGALFYPTFARGHRLTGDRHLRAVALRGAAEFARRYDATVGALRCRRTDAGVNVIIDKMMGLPLLWWGAANGGRERWADIAHRHALTTARDFVRSDGSTYHMVLYDEDTGAVIEKSTSQGYADESTWSRGQAWAVWGFTEAYRYTRDPVLLETARRVADRYLADLPADLVPYWDFQAPGIPDEPRDSSAAAVAASGLLALALLEPDQARGESYATAARATLTSLSSPAYTSFGPVPAVLLHGTLDFRSGRADVGLAYGDAFFLEALLRLRRLAPQDAALTVSRVRASAGRPALAVDGDRTTAWTTSGRQWIDLDLGSPRTTRAVRVALKGGHRRAATLRIWTSPDGREWRLARRTMSSGETGGFETYDFASRAARWVRVGVSGTTLGTGNAVTEIEVY